MTTPFDAMAPIAERSDCTADALPLAALCAAAQPVVLRGVARDWQLVQAGQRGDAEAMAVLRRFDRAQPLQYSYGGPEIAGRPFYTDDVTDLNFEVRRGSLGSVLEAIEAHRNDAQPPTYYLASLPVDDYLPGLRAGNDLDMRASGNDVQPASGSATAWSPRAITTCRIISPAARWGSGASRCFRQSRLPTCIPGRWSRRRAGRW